MERREAPLSYVTGERGRLASVPGGPAAPSRGSAEPLAPPGAPSPRFEETEKGDTALPAPPRTGPAKHCYVDNTPNLSAADKQKVFEGNAFKVYPRLKAQIE